MEVGLDSPVSSIYPSGGDVHVYLYFWSDNQSAALDNIINYFQWESGGWSITKRRRWSLSYTAQGDVELL